MKKKTEEEEEEPEEEPSKNSKPQKSKPSKPSKPQKEPKKKAKKKQEEYEDEEEVPEFKYEEKLPVGIDSHLNLYQYETFCFTNMKVTLKGKKIFKTEDRMLVFY